jgi:FkbH-like protein
MFLFDNLSGKSPAKVPAEFQRAGSPSAEARSLLVWEEHCVECAAPACYSTCDLYSPTPNGKCRRFEGGILELPAPPHSLAHIRYRKWGKLEARGNAGLLADAEVQALERRFRSMSRLLNRVGAALGKFPATRSYANLAERVLRRLAAAKTGEATRLPASFEAEIFNPGDEPVKMQFAMVIDQNRLPQAIAMADQPRPFRTVWEIAPGMNRLSVPSDDFAHLVSSGLPFLVQLTSFDERLPEIIIGKLDFVGGAAPASSGSKASAGEDEAKPRAPQVKCVVFDLDNTLWDGILLEGEVALRPGIRELFEWLDERGILISIASKNAESDALERLAKEGLDQFLLYPQINWDPKSVSLKRIAASLDIGIDTFLFVDDNPFERAQVSEVVPEVETLPDTALASLRDHVRLQGGVTAESKRRRTMYQEAARREQAAEEFDDYRRFLADCRIVLEIRPDRESDFERIAELVQRTNQLNFSGRKYDRETIKGILEDENRDRFVVDVKDRFGSYGTVGFCLASRAEDTVVIEDFMLSCRVQGKYVEQALFDYLASFYDRTGPMKTPEEGGTYPSRIVVNFKPTPRNAAALKVLQTLDFAERAGGGYERRIEPGDLAVDFMIVNPA